MERMVMFNNREVVVVGNGVSRKNQDLLAWKYRCGSMIGCNQLYKETIPDILVSADWKMSMQIMKDVPFYPGMHIYRDRSVWKVRVGRMILVSLDLSGWSSGGRALWFAGSLCDPEVVHVIGFDLDWTPDGKYNNMYAGDELYKPEGSKLTPPDNFIKQFVQTVERFPKIKFIRYIPTMDAVNKTLDKFANVEHRLYE